MDPETGELLDILPPLAQRQIQELGSHNTKVSEIVAQEDRAVFTAIQEGLDKANEHATSNAMKVGLPCCCTEGFEEYKHSRALMPQQVPM